MVLADTLDRARASYERQAWRQAHELLSEADRDTPLDAEDVERLAACAHMLGDDANSADLWARAHQEFLARGNAERAAHCAFRIGIALVLKGQFAHGNGWIARGRRILDDAGQDSVVYGFLLMPEAIRSLRTAEAPRAYELFSKVLAIGERFKDTDLISFGRIGQGRSLIRLGRLPEGIALLDEVMVAVTAGEVRPLSVGDVYCTVIDACTEIFDLRRAHEWTSALERWCENQPDQIPYRGACLVKRAEILQIHGSWADAMGEAERACTQLLLPPPKPAAGTAFYQCGELHRLRGEFDKAEAAYRQASELGRKPQPGLALLRLAQGDTDAALATVRLVVDETADLSVRSRALGAFVEILIAANEVTEARRAAAQLHDIATRLDAPFLRAMASYSLGAVELADGNPESALSALRGSLDTWRDVEAPYDEARTRVLIAVAARELGDDDTAKLELDVARGVFQRLGALVDVARVDALTDHSAPSGPTKLTARELEVLALVATGKTNRAIADGLRLSEKTVARHVSNIFTKLGLSSRAAATAYAYRNRLV